MAQREFTQPDGEAMHRLLEEYWYQPTGIILYLAWREGLTRGEICGLSWDQVDFDAGLLRLPDREVPLESDVAEVLRKWRFRCERFNPYVAVSDRLRKRLAPQSVTTLARNALDRAGQTGVRLQDLRYDYVRRKLRDNDWAYVLRISGLSFSSYRTGPDWLKDAEKHAVGARAGGRGDELKLNRVLHAERATAAGVALWLTTRLALDAEEIVRLEWDDVDFERGVLRLPGRDAALPADVRMVLADEKARRAPGDDPHVILTPRSRRPMDSSRLGVLVRAALIRGGVEHLSLSDLKQARAKVTEREALLRYVRERGSISRSEAAELLDLSDGQAYRRLLALAEDGALLRINRRYYPGDEAVRPEEQRAAVRDYAAARGAVKREEVAELLHIGKRHAARLLKTMVEAGELELCGNGKSYALPPRPAALGEVVTGK